MIKLRFCYLLVFISGAVLFVNCRKNISGTEEGVSLKLHTCSGKSLPYHICFDSVIEDSRCPEGMECFWSGTAIISVNFHERGNIHQFRMSLRGYPGIGYPNDTTINGFRIIFADLQPYPNFNSPIPDEKDIKATFQITN